MAHSIIRLLNVHLWGPARRLCYRGAVAVRAWATPDANPFLQKALRLELRRHKPLLSVAYVSLSCFVFCLAMWWLWQQLVSTLFAGHHDLRYYFQLRSSYVFYRFILRTFGENPIGWFAQGTALVCGCAVLWSARARAAYLLRQEVIKNTLVQLQQLPIAEERWVWLMAAHPALLGMVIGLCGMPVFALAVYTGQWSVIDVLGLFVVFFLLGHTTPIWMPAMWQQRSGKDVLPKMTLQQRQELLKQAQEAAERGDVSSTLESRRRLQRSLSGLDHEISSSVEQPGKNSGFLSRANYRQNTSGSISLFWLVICGNIMMQVGATMGRGTLSQITDGWPSTITSLLPAFPLTWPLLLSRLLFTPLPFFAFSFPPVLLVIPLWVCLAHNNIVNIAGQVSSAETFWGTSRLRRRSIIQWLVATGMLTLVFGFGWQVLIEGAELSRAIAGGAMSKNVAVAAGWTLAMVLATFTAGLTVEAPFKRALAGQMTLQQAWRQSLRQVGERLLFALLCYFVFCWLGGKTGVNHVWLARLPVVSATCLAFLLADFGSAALGATLGERLRRVWTTFRFIWFHFLGLSVLIHIAVAMNQKRTFTFADAPYVLFSPFVTLFSLFRTAAAQPLASQPVLWLSLFIQGILGIVFIGLAHRAIFARMAAAPEASALESATDVANRQPPWLTLLLRLGLFLTWPLRQMERAFEKLTTTIDNVNDSTMRWGAKRDNAVLTYELRRRMRKESWVWFGLAFLFGEAVLFCVCTQPWDLWRLPAGTGVLRDWGTNATYGVLILMALFAMLASLSLGRAFDADKANGTLVFLFLTPQTDREILAGKLAVEMLRMVSLLATGLIWLTIGGWVAAVPGQSPVIAFHIFCALMGIAAITIFASLTGLFFACRARKPTEGQSWSLLTFLVTFIVVVVFTIYFTATAPSKISISSGAATGIALLLVAFALCFGSWVMWRCCLASFARLRYGDIQAAGKGAS